MIGLRRKPTYNELIDYIEIEKPKIRFPDRTATLLRNSHYLSQFDGNLFDVEEQQKNITKAQLRETQIRNIAQTQGTATLLRSDAAQEQNRRTTAEATRSSAENRAKLAENKAKKFVASVVANSVAKKKMYLKCLI